ncbi:MAG: hypothetical protein A2845_02045 [Candidatus Lloydbacteria bacterium RIFCSPHIGHO2_01_FULL_49_22]|uniref:Uncharacterized protein n=1 Tax=Candidatus Lloydbacteria bacterium RIFCSPHIGHO2_01_FULL_49_22 TaxID=1798658 RepID=A0A1G2CVM4_9BACT|nr:MAG: hypothetical protein A2845_02045 [Candidatus Lloydbacteria bacterium RIFCSPHIGHO2_01_FULL_49_22]
MGERNFGEVPQAEQPVEKPVKKLAGPRIQPRYHIGPDGSVRGIKSIDDAKELGEENRDAAREQRAEQ